MKFLYKIGSAAFIGLLFLPTTCVAQRRTATSKRAPSRDVVVGFECPSGNPNQPRPKVHIRRGDLSAKALELPQPTYPQEAKDAGIAGEVQVEVVIQLDTGKVIWARIKSGNPLFQESVREVICQVRFPPAYDIDIHLSAIVAYKFGLPLPSSAQRIGPERR
jgi:TonB family protein